MDRIIRKRDVERLIGLSYSSIRRQMARGQFPKPVAIGPRAVGWRESEVRAWIAGLPVANLPPVIMGNRVGELGN